MIMTCSYCHDIFCVFQSKLNEHLSNVKDFHAMLKIHTEWLGNAEKILASFKHPSKLVDRVVQQIRDHSVCIPSRSLHYKAI